MKRRPVLEVEKEVFDSNIAKYKRLGKPVVIRNYVKDWPALKKWDVSYLKDKVGEQNVTVEYYPRGTNYQWNDVKSRATTVSAYLDSLENYNKKRNKTYLSQISIPNQLQALVKDIALPKLVDQKTYTNANLFLGKDCLSRAHFHVNGHALLCQVEGRKRVILYAPEQTKYLYPYPMEKRTNFSLACDDSPDSEAVNLKKYPKYAKTRPIECILTAGDSLFIPLYWWHSVYGVGMSVSVTFLWCVPEKEYDNPIFSPEQLAIQQDMREKIKQSKSDYANAVKLGLIKKSR